MNLGTIQALKVDMVTPIGEGRCNLARFMYWLRETDIKTFFSGDILFVGLPWIQRNLSLEGVIYLGVCPTLWIWCLKLRECTKVI